VVLDVLPGEHQDRLPEDAEELYALQRCQRHCDRGHSHCRHSAHAAGRHIYREHKPGFMRDGETIYSVKIIPKPVSLLSRSRACPPARAAPRAAGGADRR
jgi:hypothetical protein